MNIPQTQTDIQCRLSTWLKELERENKVAQVCGRTYNALIIRLRHNQITLLRRCLDSLQAERLKADQALNGDGDWLERIS